MKVFERPSSSSIDPICNEEDTGDIDTESLILKNKQEVADIRNTLLLGCNTLRDRFRNYEDRIKDLESKLSSCELNGRQDNVLVNELRLKDQESKLNLDQLKFVKDELRESLYANEALKGKLDSNELKLSESIESNATLKLRINQLQKIITSQSDLIESQKEKDFAKQLVVDSKDEDIASLEEAISELKGNLKEECERTELYRKSVEILQSEINELSNRLDDSLESKEALESEVGKWKANVDSLSHEVSSLNLLKSKLASRDVLIDELRTEVYSKSKQLETLIEENDQLQLELLEYESICKSMDTQLDIKLQKQGYSSDESEHEEEDGEQQQEEDQFATLHIEDLEDDDRTILPHDSTQGLAIINGDNNSVQTALFADAFEFSQSTKKLAPLKLEDSQPIKLDDDRHHDVIKLLSELSIEDIAQSTFQSLIETKNRVINTLEQKNKKLLFELDDLTKKLNNNTQINVPDFESRGEQGQIQGKPRSNCLNDLFDENTNNVKNTRFSYQGNNIIKVGNNSRIHRDLTFPLSDISNIATRLTERQRSTDYFPLSQIVFDPTREIEMGGCESSAPAKVTKTEFEKLSYHACKKYYRSAKFEYAHENQLKEDEILILAQELFHILEKMAKFNKYIKIYSENLAVSLNDETGAQSKSKRIYCALKYRSHCVGFFDQFVKFQTHYATFAESKEELRLLEEIKGGYTKVMKCSQSIVLFNSGHKQTDKRQDNNNKKKTKKKSNNNAYDTSGIEQLRDLNDERNGFKHCLEELKGSLENDLLKLLMGRYDRVK